MDIKDSLIKPFAIEPSLFYDISFVKKIYKNIRFDYGRAIADFPVGWYDTVYKMIKFNSKEKLKQMERNDIMNFLVNLKSKIVPCKASKYYDSSQESDSANWNNSVKKASLSDDCDIFAFISKNNVSKNRKVIEYLEIDDNKRFECERNKIIERTEKCFNDVMGPVFDYAKNYIILVDPYIRYESSDDRWSVALKVISKYINDRDIQFHIITMFDDEKNKLFDISSVQRLRKHIKTKQEVKFTILKNEPKHHNRFVFTDRCGVLFPYGLDMPGNSKDVVVLLEQKVYETILGEYQVYDINFKKSNIDLKGLNNMKKEQRELALNNIDIWQNII